MNFRRNLDRDEPDINLLPLIDVLLVIVIFLAASTTFTRFSQLSVKLPGADGAPSDAIPALTVTVAADGRYALNGKALPYQDTAQLSDVLRRAAAGRNEPTLIIDADAAAAHQSVMHALEAAQHAGITRIGFTTEALSGPAGH
jgi:biopolymer transport protein ExbD